MASTNNFSLLKYLTPFLLNGLMMLAAYLVGKQTNASPYGLAVYILIIMATGLIINLIFLFIYLFNKDYKTAAIYFLAAAAITVFFIRL